MIYAYDSGIEMSDYNENNLPWMARTVAGESLDEIVMNLGFGSIEFSEGVDVINSCGMALIMNYKTCLRERNLSRFEGRHRIIHMAKRICNGQSRKKVYITMCKIVHWGYFIIETTTTGGICNVASVSRVD